MSAQLETCIDTVKNLENTIKSQDGLINSLRLKLALTNMPEVNADKHARLRRDNERDLEGEIERLRYELSEKTQEHGRTLKWVSGLVYDLGRHTLKEERVAIFSRNEPPGKKLEESDINTIKRALNIY
jgi:hypothetical protein